MVLENTQKYNTKLDIKKIIFIISLLFPIFEPKLFTQYKITVLIYAMLNFLVLVYCIINYYRKNKKISKILIFWIIYRLYIVALMLINNNLLDIYKWGYLSLQGLNLIMVFELYYKNNRKEFIYSIFIISTFWIFVNAMSLLIFPRGIIKSDFWDVKEGDYYILGIKTQFTNFIFPSFCSAMCIKYIYNKKMPALISIILSIFTIFYSNISTAIVGLIMILILCFIMEHIKINWNYKFLCASMLILQIGIVFFNIQNIFAPIIENILGKDITLSSRIYIWSSAKNILFNQNIFNVIFGNGLINGGNFVYYMEDFWQPHNQILYQLFMTGFFGTIVELILILNLDNSKDKKFNKNHKFLIIICSVIVFLSTVEVYFEVAVCFVPFLLLYYDKHFLLNKTIKGV